MPLLEFTSLAHQTASEFLTSFDRAAAHCEQAMVLALRFNRAALVLGVGRNAVAPARSYWDE